MSDDWKTVGVAPLNPDAACSLADSYPNLWQAWYWREGAMQTSPGSDGSGDPFRFAPIALLRQVRCGDEGENQTRVVPGKLTLEGIVIPVDKEPPSGAEDEGWVTNECVYLPGVIWTLTTNRGRGAMLVCLLLEKRSNETRVKLGGYVDGEIKPTTSPTFGLDPGPWRSDAR